MMKSFVMILVVFFPSVASADAGLIEYQARRHLLAECQENRGLVVGLPPETPTGSMREALAGVQRRLGECARESERRTEATAQQPPAPAVAAASQSSQPTPAPVPAATQSPTPVPAPATVAAQQMEVADPIPEFPPELLEEVRRTLHRVLDGDAPDPSVTALARSLRSMEEVERDVVLDCIEDSGSRVRSEREPDRRLRRLRTAVRDCVNPPEPEATPEQLAEVAESMMFGAAGAGAPFGPGYSAALEGVGFVDSYPARWREAGGRQLTIKNFSRRCYLEVRLDGRAVTMVRGGEPLVARVEGRADLIPVVPPSQTAAIVLPDDEEHSMRLVCHQGTVDYDGPEDRTVNAMGQPVVVASSGPVRPVGYRNSTVYAAPGPPIEIRDTDFVRLNQRR